MSSERPNRVSVIDPITPAIDRVKLMLFQPFDLRKWFVIGFCAWLAYLGGGGSGDGGPHYNFPHGPREQEHQIKEGINAGKEFFLDNMYWIVPVVVIVVVAIVVISLLIVWLNSRGKFMFLHCIAGNKSEVKVPWHKFRKHGNSLFLFRIVLGIIGLVVVCVPVIAIITLAIMLATQAIPNAASILGIIFLVLITFALTIVLFLIKKFTFDFVVPIMFLRTSSCLAGWREFMAILSANKLRFALYLLFQIVISIVISVIIMIGFFIGLCLCCASCLLLILSILSLNYIGTVILLPLSVFKRSYSLYYLQQYGPQFDVFSSEPQTELIA